MTLQITRDNKGRFVVSDDTKVYGRYRSEDAAIHRARVVYSSRKPSKEKKT